jgi:hypothetical protein
MQGEEDLHNADNEPYRRTLSDGDNRILIDS